MKKTNFYKKFILEALGYKKWLYLIAFLIIFIPICITMVSDIVFSHTFSKITLSISIILIIIGKSLTSYSRNKGDKRLHTDIGFIIALLIILLSNIFER